MKLIVSTAGRGKTRMVVQKAIEMSKDNKPVLILTDEYSMFNEYVKEIQNSSVLVRQVYAMGDIVKAIAFTPTHYKAIFIDVSFVPSFIRSTRIHQIYQNTNGYIDTEVFITVQLNSNEGVVDAHIVDYDPDKYNERGLSTDY
jgi:hypothetical protein